MAAQEHNENFWLDMKNGAVTITDRKSKPTKQYVLGKNGVGWQEFTYTGEPGQKPTKKLISIGDMPDEAREMLQRNG